MERFVLNGRPKISSTRRASVPTEMWITDNVRDFSAFWPCSKKLGNAICYAFQCADILELHCETFLPARNATPWFIAILNDRAEPLALIPLMIERHRKIRSLRFIDGALSDYNAPVLFPLAQDWDAEIIGLIWRGLKKVLPFDFAIFEKVPECIGHTRNPFVYLISSNQGQSCHFFSLSATWQEISARVPRRKELERKNRRLGKRGTIKFEVAETPELYDVILATLIRQKRQRDLDAHGGNDTFSIPGFLSYLMEARKLVYPSGPVVLFALRIDDVIIAAHWGYVVGARFYSLIPSFEGGEWYSYSPGFILADKIIRWCQEKGLEIFDYGWGDEPYKREYCNLSTRLYRAEIPATVMGRLYLSIRKLKRRLARTKSKFWRTKRETASLRKANTP
jgi:CelD/BcsL family acetyltransferase involved in cellulose biosynthesis